MLAMTPSGSGLARQSVDAWNAWVAEHDGWHVDFRAVDFTKACNAEISFQDFRYSGAVNFRSAKFDEAQFNAAVFKGTAAFDDAIFTRNSVFRGAMFVSVRCPGPAVIPMVRLRSGLSVMPGHEFVDTIDFVIGDAAQDIG